MLHDHIDRTTPRLKPSDEDREVQPTLGFQRVLQRAVFQVQSGGRREVGVANVLIAIFSEKQSHAVFLLTRARGHPPRRDAVRLARFLAKIAEEKTAARRSSREGERERRGRQRARQVRRPTSTSWRAGRKASIR